MLHVCPQISRARQYALAALLALGASTTVPGQTPEAWVRQHWNEAESFPPLGGLALQMETRVHYFPSDDELRALAEDVADLHPKDPQVLQYEAYLRRKENGPDVLVEHALWEGPDRWRLSTGSVTEESRSFLDMGIDGDTGWKLTDEWLVLMDSRAEWPKGHPVGWSSLQLRLKLGYFLYGGFRLARLRELDLDDVQTSTGRFVAVARGPHGLRFEFSGRYDDALGRGFVERARVVESGGFATEKGMTWTFSDYRLVANTDRWIAHHVEQRTGDDRIVQVRRVLEARVLEEDRLAALLELPDPDTSDPIRGDVRPLSITDFRGGSQTERIRKDGEYVVHRDIRTETEVRVEDAYRTLGRAFGIALTLSLFLVAALRKVLRVKANRLSLQAA